MKDEKKPKAQKKKPSLKKEVVAKNKDNLKPDPTKFGDWTVKGRCIDF